MICVVPHAAIKLAFFFSLQGSQLRGHIRHSCTADNSVTLVDPREETCWQITNSTLRYMKPAAGSYISEQTAPHMKREPLVCVIIQFNRRLNLRHFLMTTLPLIIPSRKEH